MPDLFDKLPFKEAIDALRERLAIPKSEFLKLDAANRSRAFTMARVSDQALLENIHDEISVAIADGETYLDFRKRLEALQERSGWTGTSPWHYRVVYDQNLGMAYSAGRVQQGQASGLRVWRYLPSVSATPRPEHEAYYGELYRMAPGSPVPPIDFGCNCGWEWVFEDELEAMGVDPETLPVFDPPVPKSGFVWSATNYFDLSAAVSANAEVSSFMFQVSGLETRNSKLETRYEEKLVACAAIEAIPKRVQTWFELAVNAAAQIGVEKLERLAAWIERAGDLTTARNFIDDAMPVVRSEEEVELNHLVTLAALLEGRAAVFTTETRRARRVA